MSSRLTTSSPTSSFIEQSRVYLLIIRRVVVGLLTSKKRVPAHRVSGAWSLPP